MRNGKSSLPFFFLSPLGVSKKEREKDEEIQRV
jgi:hypothetical protein